MSALPIVPPTPDTCTVYAPAGSVKSTAESAEVLGRAKAPTCVIAEDSIDPPPHTVLE